MKQSDLIWAICEVDEDLLPLSETADVRTARVRPLRRVLVAAALTLLLAGTVLAAFASRHWEDILIQFFCVEETDQQRMDDALQDVYAAETQDGIRFTLKQLLGDDHCLMLVLEVTLPEDLELDSISADDLRTLAEANGFDWEHDVTETLKSTFGYEEGRAEYSDAPYLADFVVYPVTVETAEYRAELERLRAERVSEGEEYARWDDLTAFRIFSARMREELGESFYEASGSSVVRRYDPETRTLTILSYAACSASMAGRPFTLAINHLWLYRMEEVYGQSFSEAREYGQDLLSEPVVLHFTADYKVISRRWDILSGERLVGTLQLSPISAWLSFHSIVNVESLLSGLSVIMEDGSEITLSPMSIGQHAFFVTQELIDPDQVRELQLAGYTLRPQD